MSNPARLRSRRVFLGDCLLGLGSLASLAAAGRLGATAPEAEAGPLSPRAPHFAPRAKNVILLYMSGGPSQLDLFVYKPALARHDGETVPESLVKDKKFAFISSDAKLLRPLWKL